MAIVTNSACITVEETRVTWFPAPHAPSFPTGPVPALSVRCPWFRAMAGTGRTHHECPGGQFLTGAEGALHRIATPPLANRITPPGYQRAGASKVALRRNPAGICNAEVFPNCRCAASSSSSRGSRIMTCCPSFPATETTGATGWAGAGAAASCAPEDGVPCSPAKELQPIATTAANEANPAAIFQRNTDALAATAVSARTTCSTAGAASGRRPCMGSCANCSRTRITIE
ncbi:hypothetical protein SAMN05421875_103181 [Acidovorax soli]|uniref:Uncharacterized protein n=1 Tax=Acidovorax soli TaxID=592050 RepID=A0A1H3X307_9BURK|nr:hypothetical protein SAMN05421875_103181 [Acidovorax soli]